MCPPALAGLRWLTETARWLNKFGLPCMPQQQARDYSTVKIVALVMRNTPFY